MAPKATRKLVATTRYHFEGTERSIELEPCGHRVIIRPRTVAQTTASGLYKPEPARDMEKRATMVGTVVAVGRQAWAAFADGVPWAKAGETVIFSKYSGADVPEEIRRAYDPDAEPRVIINDEDILSVINEVE